MYFNIHFFHVKFILQNSYKVKPSSMHTKFKNVGNKKKPKEIQ
jgi:hypothetical protein